MGAVRGNAEEVDEQRSDPHGLTGQATVFKRSQEQQANIISYCYISLHTSSFPDPFLKG